jgi:outer membrane biosynthesis protein TonB
MNGSRHFVLLALALSLATSGCSWFHKKKPPVPQAQAPTITQPAPAPAPVTSQPAPPTELTKPAEETAEKPKPKPRPAHPATAKKVPPAPAKPVEQASAQPPRIVIQEGGAAPGNTQVSPTAPHQALDQQRTTQQLLDATDTNLRSLTRTLTPDEKAMVEQIRSYMQQSRDATRDGDITRAHNLALKAHLLSDELVKP